ncbi:DUF6879 family protein [Nocardiopsis nanhaiensis]
MTTPTLKPARLDEQVLALINNATGTRLDRATYLEQTAHLRTAAHTRGIAWQLDTLSTRPPHDQAWQAWCAGRYRTALNLLAGRRPTVQAQRMIRYEAGLTLRRLVVAPVAIGASTAFALEATRVLAECGEQVRVIEVPLPTVPEFTIYGHTVFRLCARADQVADGAMRLDDPRLCEVVLPSLEAWWDQAQDFGSFYADSRLERRRTPEARPRPPQS